MKVVSCHQLRCNDKAVVLAGFKLPHGPGFGLKPCCLKCALANVVDPASVAKPPKPGA